jgi:hypothetical protein
MANKKPTYEFVKNSFEDEGYTLLSKKYINNHTKLLYICTKGHRHSIIWRNWQRGDRCPYCAGQGKPTIEVVRKSFEVEGYTLLSKEYINNSTKLEYICPNGHQHSITWGNWISNNRCFYCSNKVSPSIRYIESEFKKENYILLTKLYKNNNTKLDYICPNKHEESITWANWVTGFRCPTCATINNSGRGHWNWQGGLSLEPYCGAWNDKEYKADIRERDGNTCLNPYCYGTDSVLSIHHIDYNKQNCAPSNLITVCRACNSRANYDRDWHRSWYRAILRRRYNYEY